MRPRTSRSPSVGSVMPQRIWSSVVLPEPLRPTRATRSPFATATSMPRITQYSR